VWSTRHRHGSCSRSSPPRRSGSIAEMRARVSSGVRSVPGADGRVGRFRTHLRRAMRARVRLRPAAAAAAARTSPSARRDRAPRPPRAAHRALLRTSGSRPPSPRAAGADTRAIVRPDAASRQPAPHRDRRPVPRLCRLAWASVHLRSSKFGRAGRLRSRHGATMGQESARPGEPSRA
jgi:hypothetical protein